MNETKTLDPIAISDEEDQKMCSLDSDDDNDRNDNNQTKGDKIYSVVINGTKQNFMFSDLIRIEYFRNYLSNRWQYGDEIKVELDDKKFNVKELKTIIDCKKYQQIYNNYDFSRIQNLINALDYFQEKIDHNIFYQYLLGYVPLIRPNQINIICHSNNNENEDEQYDPMKDFSKATKMYKDLYSNSRMNLVEKFVNNWKTIPIITIGKMRNVTYLILMKTLKLIKTESKSDHLAANWYDRDCEISIEFIQERSLEDFNHLWNVMLHSHNETYLINILSTIIGQYSRKSDLEYWGNHSQCGIYYQNEYKQLEYKNNIRRVCGQMITHVAKNIFFDSIHCVEELKQIINQYVEAIQNDKELANKQNAINEFYNLLTDAYFTNTVNVFKESIEILFHTKCFNQTVLTTKYANTSYSEKYMFLMSMLESMKNYDANNENIYRFFMRRSKDEMVRAVSFLLNEDETALNMENMTYLWLNSCIKLFKKLLEAEGDKETLDKLYVVLIDEVLFKYVKNERMLRLMLDICDDDSINRRFAKLDGEKISFLKYLLIDQLMNEKIAWKQNRLTTLTQFLLDENMNEALQIFDVWFPIFAVKEKQWIIHKMLDKRYKLWNVIANSHHINHLFNILLTTINEYLPNSKSSDIHDNIKMVCCHLIISVAERIFYDEIHYIDYGEQLKEIIQTFLKVICSKDDTKYTESLMNQFYTRLIVAYFRYTHYTFDETIEILFERSLFNAKKLKEIYLDLLTSHQKHTFLQSIFKSITNDNMKFENIYRFFIKMNQHESLQYIVQHLLKTEKNLFLFIKLFKEILEQENDAEVSDALHTFLIDEHLFKFVQNDQLWILILDVCDADTINSRFLKLKGKKINFLKYLLTETSMNKELAIKQKKLAKCLLNANKREAFEIWNIWFPILMNEEQDWITQEMFNEKNLSFTKMQEILDIVSDLLINDVNDTVPQTYFDFIDKYTTAP